MRPVDSLFIICNSYTHTHKYTRAGQCVDLINLNWSFHFAFLLARDVCRLSRPLRKQPRHVFAIINWLENIYGRIIMIMIIIIAYNNLSLFADSPGSEKQIKDSEKLLSTSQCCCRMSQFYLPFSCCFLLTFARRVLTWIECDFRSIWVCIGWRIRVDRHDGT